MGVLAGLAGMLYAARLNSAVVNAGVGIELITATLLGFASLKGGEGIVFGGIKGVLFIALMENAMIIKSVGGFWQGIVVLFAAGPFQDSGARMNDPDTGRNQPADSMKPVTWRRQE